jgi:integrase
VLNPYNIALAKLGRNNDRDRDDVLFLARTFPFDLDLFESRFREELAPFVMGSAREKADWFRSWCRACAKLCRKRGGDLEQIKFLLGHASIQTTERYLGAEQDFVSAVNDNLGLER